ncbi:hypothetical protein LWI29_035857 [Acer saccharum]|uniref:C-JID domain-containing protein n=1 Tax=Acer saccharum TaxID=4024 RepID=A0AA39SYZ6_ACESA|nr:hypothetical protein LWI29_035857 [Acer saccharum]
MADAQLRIQVMATKARGTASLKDYLKGYLDEASFSFCCPGNEIPEWFSHQRRGARVVIKLPLHWCSTKFLGFALCVVAAFEDCEYFNFCFNCKCYFLTKDGEVHEIVCDIDGMMKIDGRLGFMESDHVFLLYAHGLSAVFQRDDGEHNLSIYSSCREALFEFSPVDEYLQPIRNCKIKKCGVHLLYLEEETTQISGDDSLNEAGLVESGGDGIQNIVEDEEVPNSTTLEEEGTENKSESEIDTLLSVMVATADVIQWNDIYQMLALVEFRSTIIKIAKSLIYEFLNIEDPLQSLLSQYSNEEVNVAGVRLSFASLLVSFRFPGVIGEAMNILETRK